MNVIHIATEADAVFVNQVADILGKGPNNLSVQLVDANGNKYLGCHSSAWTEEDFQLFKARTGFSEFCTQEQLDVLDQLYESAMPESEEYNALDHWLLRLQERGLSELELTPVEEPQT